MLVGSATLASGAVTADLADGRVPDASVLAALRGLGTNLLVLVLLRVQAVFVTSTSSPSKTVHDGGGSRGSVRWRATLNRFR